MNGPDYIVDIPGLDCSSGRKPGLRRPNGRRSWLAIQWKCCGAYSRIYRNREGNAYVGHCPSCARPLRVGISPTGVSNRFFEAW